MIRSVSRRILHCDMDCFYAAVHMRDDPSLHGKPVVIGGSPEGRGVVAAASYEARAFGIHSAQPAARAVRLCPDLVFIKSDFKRYREESARVFEIFKRFTSEVQPVSIDEAYLDVTDEIGPWGSATALAREIKLRVREERGLTVSIGVGPNKLIAKIASDFDKPDGLTVVPPRRVQAFLDPLSVRALPGVGPATEKRMKKAGITTVADLRALPLDHLISRFGRSGAWLYNCARGIDERPVRVRRSRKSLSHERTYAQDLRTLEQMDAQVESLGQRVAADLGKKNLSTCTVSVKVRYSDFTTLTRSFTLAGPTCDPDTIAMKAKILLRRTEAGQRQVRLLGVSASNLVHGSVSQLELFRSD
jgi:DNA polymerase-4